jgi:3-oxoacyl-[acyl-carrier-protein] synthase II
MAAQAPVSSNGNGGPPRGQPSRRVVVTGLGVICPLGNSPQALWDGLIAGRSGVVPSTAFAVRGLPMSFAGEAREFTAAIEDFGPLEGDQKKAIRKGLKTICREAQMGIAAAQRALFDARLTQGKFDPERTGVVFGSDYMITEPEEFTVSVRECVGADGRFEFDRWAADGLTKMNPLWLLKYLPNMPAAHLAIYNDLRGPNNSLTLREASSNLAIGEALRTIARGHADIMVAGATGTWIHPVKAMHAVLQQELAVGDCPPERACRPFDLHRQGMVLGEGAGAIVLEELSQAQRRGATILGEVCGTASSQVANRNRVAQRDVALVNALRACLRDAGATIDDVGHIHAHGLSSRSGDLDEAWAFSQVFGARMRDIPVVAAKSNFGNLGAGSGAVELIASLLALQHGRLFPLLNYETPDPDCPIAAVTTTDVPPGKSFLNVNVTLQGQASCVLVRAFEG